MDFNQIMQSISVVGFPIAMCCAMAWYVKYTTDKNREQINEMNDRHNGEMKEVTTAVNNNTLALTKLCDTIKKEATL